MTPIEAWKESPEEAAGLVSRAQAGDTAAFERLYRQHAGRMYAVCLRIIADRPAAEECTQDAFVRAWGALDKFRGDSSFGTWLTRIAINVALQRLKLDRRHLRLIQPDGEKILESLPGASDTPEADMDLERLIASLPPAARMVFVLHAIEGYSHEEIAELTGRSIGTCKAHVHRARQILQARMQI
ncbi:MAG: sigma-70 family RNA polymerase sigma factor [Gammaproteobacteria bacterium]